MTEKLKQYDQFGEDVLHAEILLDKENYMRRDILEALLYRLQLKEVDR